MVTPTTAHWMHAAQVLAAIRRLEHHEATKIRELAFDTLIALTARSIEATVITCNASDFAVIRRHLVFPVLYWP